MADTQLRQLLARPWGFLALGFGSGLVPHAPGTAGTLVALPLYLLLRPLPVLYYVLLVCALFLLGIWLCRKAADALGVHDHPAIVWDEVVGYLFTMILAPAQWQWVVTGFVLFRLFDIVKPWPIRWCDQQIPGGLGIMFDDLLAAVYSAACLQFIVWLLNRV